MPTPNAPYALVRPPADTLADGNVTFIERRNPSAPRKNLTAKRLLALAEGISVQRILDVNRWSLDELREALSSEVDALLGPPEIPLQG